MTVFTGIILYLLIWWTLLFAVLPFGVKIPDTPELGHAPSAPTNPKLKQKFIATTILAAVIWLVIFAIIRYDILSLNEVMKSWASSG